MALKKIICRRCGKPTEYTPENPYRPFCSERCQLIDLGQWATEKYAVPIEDKTPPEEATQTSDRDDDGEI